MFRETVTTADGTYFVTSIVPGSYEVTFDGSRLASGLYFYRMSVGSFVQTRRMVLIR